MPADTITQEAPAIVTERRFTIDPAAKRINAATINLNLAQGSRNADRFVFTIPGVAANSANLAACNSLLIHFENIGEEPEQRSCGIYSVKDLHIGTDATTFSWLIGDEATAYAGSLIFSVRFTHVDENGKETYIFPTLQYTRVTVGPTVWNSDTIAREHPDIIAQFDARIAKLESNDGPGGGISQETDPTVPSWAKEDTKPSYSKSEVGLGNVDNVRQYSADNPPPYPVSSVNGKTGVVSMSASDVGARPNTWTPTYSDVGADKSGAAAAAVNTHNTAEDSHNDIRLELKAINDRLTAFFDSDDKTLDELSEIVAYITNNKDLIDSITTSKVSVDDIVNNLTTNVANKPLSAAQGVVLKGLIDTVGKSLADYQPKGNYLTEETDPTVPSWAKADTKPSYSKSEVGLGNVDNVRQYSADNPPPYPVSSVNGKTGDVSLSASDVGARPNTWTPTYSDVGADKSGAASTAVSSHNTAEDSHNDIRLALKDINDRLTAFFDSDDKTLDELSEIVAYITNNKDLIDSITTSKVSVDDIVNNLTTNVANKPLSAAQGVVLKGLIDALSNGKLDASALTQAINTALAQAKASGEFDGDKGDKGDPGLVWCGEWSSGRGYSFGDVVSYNGTAYVWSSKVAPPEWMPPEADDEWQVLARRGKDGKNPVKGSDYFTPADKAEMVQAVIAALPVYAGEVV